MPDLVASPCVKKKTTVRAEGEIDCVCHMAEHYNTEIWQTRNAEFLPLHLCIPSTNLTLYTPCIIYNIYKPTRCTKFLWLDFIFHQMLYMFRNMLVHHQEQPFISCTSHLVYAGTICGCWVVIATEHPDVCVGNFLTSWVTASFSRTLLREVKWDKNVVTIIRIMDLFLLYLLALPISLLFWKQHLPLTITLSSCYSKSFNSFPHLSEYWQQPVAHEPFPLL